MPFVGPQFGWMVRWISHGGQGGTQGIFETTLEFTELLKISEYLCVTEIIHFVKWQIVKFQETPEESSLLLLCSGYRGSIAAVIRKLVELVEMLSRFESPKLSSRHVSSARKFH